MGNLTVRQLYAACKQNQYLLVRHQQGVVVGINCKAVDMALVRNWCDKQSAKPTQWVSLMPCSFHQYISHKMPFL